MCNIRYTDYKSVTEYVYMPIYSYLRSAHIISLFTIHFIYYK